VRDDPTTNTSKSFSEDFRNYFKSEVSNNNRLENLYRNSPLNLGNKENNIGIRARKDPILNKELLNSGTNINTNNIPTALKKRTPKNHPD